MDSVRTVVDQKGISACAIIHDLDLALRFCDKSILLNEGNIVCFGRTEDVLTSENIKEVFGVDSCIETIRGSKHLIIL
jgi:iron complex transport system ATP-binding protein